MKVLALNTAFSNSDVAILIDDKKFYSSFASNSKHSENALVCIDKLLRQNNVDIQNFETISVVVGPGSFTGIRIGIALAKGMCVAKPDLKLVSICSLDLMAYIYVKKHNDKEFWCAIDALSGNIYVCKYDKKGMRMNSPQMLTAENISDISGVVVGLNDDNLDFCLEKVSFNPESLLDYTLELIDKKQFVSESNFLPIYLRKSQAEMGLENANKKN